MHIIEVNTDTMSTIISERTIPVEIGNNLSSLGSQNTIDIISGHSTATKVWENILISQDTEGWV